KRNQHKTTFMCPRMRNRQVLGLTNHVSECQEVNVQRARTVLDCALSTMDHLNPLARAKQFTGRQVRGDGNHGVEVVGLFWSTNRPCSSQWGRCPDLNTSHPVKLKERFPEGRLHFA